CLLSMCVQIARPGRAEIPGSPRAAHAPEERRASLGEQWRPWQPAQGSRTLPERDFGGAARGSSGCWASERSDRALLGLATRPQQYTADPAMGTGRSALSSVPRHGDGSFRPHADKGGSEGHSTSYQATSRFQDSSLMILFFEIGFSNGGTSLRNRPEASANPKMCATTDWEPSSKMRQRSRYSSCSRSDAALHSIISHQDAAATTRHASRSGTFFPSRRPTNCPAARSCCQSASHAPCKWMMRLSVS